MAILHTLSSAAWAEQPASERPYTGTYYCYTTALESDPHANNPIGVRPAPFGKLVLDGKGGYSLTVSKQTGRYRFEPHLGKLSFMGVLAAMDVSGYAADSFKLVHRGPGAAYAFNCITDGVGDPRSLNKAKPEDVRRLVAGRFSGEYKCGLGQSVAIELQLTSDDDNNVEGVAAIRLGGKSSTRPVAKYAVRGRWFKEATVSIRPDEWLENPENLPLPAEWMTGQVEQNGLSHIRMSDSCPNFTLKRAE